MKGELQDCPACGKAVNRWVNGTRCPYCSEDVFEPDSVLGGYRCLAV